ncbi:hypothetical protein BJ138DRAFT_1105917 [Hygrophoropsis aurantiaca]|uniref:Uncharacterized protein n=1 Tax=Hygrophoropsis aurantiaca TaxID=72124 RepID=A0ACB7ZWK8_9AGAM|nr:hypothetical protein BJ138DRAFT_1105917 [Hygrophoropsis aurantiaca]
MPGMKEPRHGGGGFEKDASNGGRATPPRHVRILALDRPTSLNEHILAFPPHLASVLHELSVTPPEMVPPIRRSNSIVLGITHPTHSLPTVMVFDASQCTRYAGLPVGPSLLVNISPPLPAIARLSFPAIASPSRPANVSASARMQLGRYTKTDLRLHYSNLSAIANQARVLGGRPQRSWGQAPTGTIHSPGGPFTHRSRAPTRIERPPGSFTQAHLHRPQLRIYPRVYQLGMHTQTKIWRPAPSNQARVVQPSSRRPTKRAPYKPLAEVHVTDARRALSGGDLAAAWWGSRWRGKRTGAKRASASGAKGAGGPGGGALRVRGEGSGEKCAEVEQWWVAAERTEEKVKEVKRSGYGTPRRLADNTLASPGQVHATSSTSRRLHIAAHVVHVAIPGSSRRYSSLTAVFFAHAGIPKLRPAISAHVGLASCSHESAMAQAQLQEQNESDRSRVFHMGTVDAGEGRVYDESLARTLTRLHICGTSSFNAHEHKPTPPQVLSNDYTGDLSGTNAQSPSTHHRPKTRNPRKYHPGIAHQLANV